MNIRELVLHRLYKTQQIRISKTPRCHRHHTFFVIPFFFLQCFHELIMEQSKHSNSILKLKISVILFFIRKLPLCKNIPFITGVDKMNSIFRINLLSPFINNIQHLIRIFLCKWFEWLKSITVFAKSYRNDRNTS